MVRESTIADVSREVAACVADDDEGSAIRVAYHFVERFARATPDLREAMTRDQPPSTGDGRYDALLAAIVEYSHATHAMEIPQWVGLPEYFLSPWWFIAGRPGLEAEALVNSPISFSRRGIFINSGSLTYA
jgi:hypothetical protein